MSKKPADEFNYLSNDPDFVPNPEIEEFMEEEIARAPKDPELLAHRLRNNTAASPRDAGGDLDANWEDVNESGSESVGGDNPTPDQSLVEENANAVGVNFEDNENWIFSTRSSAAIAIVLSWMKDRRVRKTLSRFFSVQR